MLSYVAIAVLDTGPNSRPDTGQHRSSAKGKCFFLRLTFFSFVSIVKINVSSSYYRLNRLCTFWSRIGYGFQGNYGNVGTYLSFQLQISKKRSSNLRTVMDDIFLRGKVWKRMWILEVRSEQSENGCEKWYFWSERGSGFGELGGTPAPRIPRSAPDYKSRKDLRAWCLVDSMNRFVFMKVHLITLKLDRQWGWKDFQWSASGAPNDSLNFIRMLLNIRIIMYNLL